MSKLKPSAQEGRALVMALIVLAVGSLLIPLFLAHASTNLLATRVTEEGMKEQYAADAGVEYAMWKLANDPNFVETVRLSTNPVTVDPPTSINNIIVTVEVEGGAPSSQLAGGCGIFDVNSVANNTTITSRIRLCGDEMHIDSWEIK